MKTMNKKLITAFNDSIQRGKNEEVGSIDVLNVSGREYYVNKIGRRTFALYAGGDTLPLIEKTV